MSANQTYQNHVRWYPLVHFVLFPLLLIHLIWRIVQLYQIPTLDRAESVLFVISMIILALAARAQALRAQDRVIRLEERLRYRGLLSAEALEKAGELSISKIIAMRFASDAELPDLVERVLAGELDSSKEIKLAIKNWRGDHLRV